MKKYLKMVGNIFMYSIIYFVLQIAAIFAGSIFYAIKYAGKVPNEELVGKIQEGITQNTFIFVATAAIVTLVIYMLILRNKEENLWQRCKFEKLSVKQYIWIVLGLISLSFVSSNVVMSTQHLFKSYEQVSKSIAAGSASFLGAICVLILLPIFEEVLFRGLIFNELRKHINIIISVALQALIFGLFHGNMLQGIYTFFLGIILAIIYVWSKSIWAPIVGHIVYNIMGIIVFPRILNYSIKFATILIIPGVIASVGFMIPLYLQYKRSYEELSNVDASIQS
ncbi:CPBP family intramembrane glutamic endopeptidase [Crassaminicella indica]|uniref:CPBP family intramembrane metalloprotease n=1 Tax=Crassaminicella indica TaxID=2855394 RepID=A0ABX8R7X7_9CLOT|nr:CPBP family intramembrane glutamic endopeptidase [Crassaminicella indica]QXM05138.1 CPBP family intramembrane metalloprotease [Crassaminicella indica]